MILRTVKRRIKRQKQVVIDRQVIKIAKYVFLLAIFFPV